MALKLHNTLTKKLDTFSPINEGTVMLYTCGPTVYDYPHVGNWAAYIYWDVLVRVLLANGYRVNRVMNITDVGHLVSDADEGEDKLRVFAFCLSRPTSASRHLCVRIRPDRQNVPECSMSEAHIKCAKRTNTVRHELRATAGPCALAGGGA